MYFSFSYFTLVPVPVLRDKTSLSDGSIDDQPENNEKCVEIRALVIINIIVPTYGNIIGG